jgi:hypothetical protein
LATPSIDRNDIKERVEAWSKRPSVSTSQQAFMDDDADTDSDQENMLLWASASV